VFFRGAYKINDNFFTNALDKWIEVWYNERWQCKIRRGFDLVIPQSSTILTVIPQSSPIIIVIA
jgi:hypothetical protein